MSLTGEFAVDAATVVLEVPQTLLEQQPQTPQSPLLVVISVPAKLDSPT
jgi:hypothetical protein